LIKRPDIWHCCLVLLSTFKEIGGYCLHKTMSDFLNILPKSGAE
jgi:hypothetical protein